jgi:hypothetical protein
MGLFFISLSKRKLSNKTLIIEKFYLCNGKPAFVAKILSIHLRFKNKPGKMLYIYSNTWNGKGD